MTSLYQHFKVDNKIELYAAVKAKDPKVSELVELLNNPMPYWASPVQMNSSRLVVNSAKKMNLHADPTKKYVFHLDNQLNAIKFQAFELEESNSKLLDALIDNNGRTSNSCIVAYPAKYLNKSHLIAYEQLIDQAEKIDLNVVDVLICDDQKVISTQEKYGVYAITRVLKDTNKEYTVNPSLVQIPSTDISSPLYQYKEYAEFSKYFCENEIKGLSYWDSKDKQKIDTLLSAYLQPLGHEEVYFLALNKESQVKSLNFISSGTHNQTSVYPNEVYKTAKQVQADHLVLIHNHPSGNPAPSGSDLMLTERLSEQLSYFNRPLVDHLIVGNKVTSLLQARIPELTTFNQSGEKCLDRYRTLQKEMDFEF